MIVVTLAAVILAGCSGSAAKEKDFDGSAYSDTGAGNFCLINASGTTENGDPIVIYADKDVVLLQIGAGFRDFDGSLLSFIYIDGYENDKIQIGDGEGTLTLEKDALAVGTHIVECVQFVDNDPAGDVVTYKKAEYEVIGK